MFIYVLLNTNDKIQGAPISLDSGLPWWINLKNRWQKWKGKLLICFELRFIIYAISSPPSFLLSYVTFHTKILSFSLTVYDELLTRLCVPVFSSLEKVYGLERGEKTAVVAGKKYGGKSQLLMIWIWMQYNFCDSRTSLRTKLKQIQRKWNRRERRSVSS